MKFNPLLLLLVLPIMSCSMLSITNGQQASACVDSFCVNYFNYNFVKAAHFCTDSSYKWLLYAASQVNEADVEILRQQEGPATCEIKELNCNEDDSITFARVQIRNFLQLDSIGKAGHIIERNTFQLELVKVADHWLVRMEGLPRSEKQNHD